MRYHRAGGPGKQREGAPSKLVLLGWGFWFQVTVCPPRRARMSKSGRRTRGIRFCGPRKLGNSPPNYKLGWGSLGVLSWTTRLTLGVSSHKSIAFGILFDRSFELLRQVIYHWLLIFESNSTLQVCQPFRGGKANVGMFSIDNEHIKPVSVGIFHFQQMQSH